MNLYILVEGEQTELQLYPQWLLHLIPELSRIDNFQGATENSYFLISGFGIPSIYNHAVNAIKDVNLANNYDYLIIALDAEELSPEERKNSLLDYIKKSNVTLNENCEIEVIIHNKCVETWFLGNRNVYKRNPQGAKFQKYSQYYNVEINDPELMGRFPDFKRTAHFHESYLREMLKEYNLRYRKSRPGDVVKEYYLKEIIKRTEDLPEHLKCFSSGIEIFNKIKLKNEDTKSVTNKKYKI
jgi:hypothetical protein